MTDEPKPRKSIFDIPREVRENWTREELSKFILENHPLFTGLVTDHRDQGSNFNPRGWGRR